jgi:cyclopropane fatty-acyl-phospholipid synthase-like methyltransferase
VTFEAAYAAGTPPWDIGRPQPAFAELAQQGALRGRVLDIGCGTGEHALLAASLGLDATGIDLVPDAIALARTKANQRGLRVRFLVHDVLEPLGEQFDTILDSGLFHVFDNNQRARYVENLATLLAPDGRLYLLCFSDSVPGTRGPRRVSQVDIRAAFPPSAWQVHAIAPATLAITYSPAGVTAWLATIGRA